MKVLKNLILFFLILCLMGCGHPELGHLKTINKANQIQLVRHSYLVTNKTLDEIQNSTNKPVTQSALTSPKQSKIVLLSHVPSFSNTNHDNSNANLVTQIENTKDNITPVKETSYKGLIFYYLTVGVIGFLIWFKFIKKSKKVQPLLASNSQVPVDSPQGKTQ